MKLTLAFTLLSLVYSKQCPVPTDGCGPILTDPTKEMEVFATFYSEPLYKGENTTRTIKGYFGCLNDVPPYIIRSITSTHSFKVVLHFGRDCAGHVLQEYQGGSPDIDPTLGCPSSIFIKFHRFGSC
ncbi:hypothetical protein DSO57_1038592 [Entomophthora muscae]|uniref:Uncharacterized protein n=1 Tax=Entomophthora muscae TaxID=34485 RepID=A0ACC2TXA6_9FUNG|nr:hypothetical protein DSO57_1038592 [Entomophthora muscae]